MAELKENDPLVVEIVSLERQLATVTSDPKFIEAVRAQKELNERIADGWKKVQGAMELSHTKNLKGDWGYITLVEKPVYRADLKKLPPEFIKQTADLKAIGDTYKLKNKLPKGVTMTITSYLTKGIK